MGDNGKVNDCEMGTRERNLEALCKTISLYIRLVVDTENVLREMDVEMFNCFSSCRLCVVNGYRNRICLPNCPTCILFEMNGISRYTSCMTAVRHELSDVLLTNNIPAIKHFAEDRLYELIDYGYNRDRLRKYLANRAPLIERPFSESPCDH